MLVVFKTSMGSIFLFLQKILLQYPGTVRFNFLVIIGIVSYDFESMPFIKTSRILIVLLDMKVNRRDLGFRA